MKALPIWLVALLLAGSGLYFGWTWLAPVGTVRYRMTIDAEVNGKTYTGSGVIEVSFQYVARVPLSNIGVSSDVRGEAIPVVLGDRGVLFVLLGETEQRAGYPVDIVLRLLGLGRSVGSLQPDQIRGLSRITAKATINEGQLLMVRFRDLADKSSVELVNPLRISERFGPGTHIARVTVETTSETVSRGIEAKYPVVSEMPSSLGAFDWQKPRDQRLTRSDFLSK
jgi:hypothetical protein